MLSRTVGFLFLGASIFCTSWRVEAATPEVQKMETCVDLSEVTYWATSAHMNKHQARRLEQAQREALKPNNRRPTIDKARVDEAWRHGLGATGGKDRGKVTLEDAHEEGLLAALYEMRDCLAAEP